MKTSIIVCGLLAALPLLLPAQSVSNGKAILEWKDGVMELRPEGGKAGKIIFRPAFTNGTDIKTASVTRFTLSRKGIMLHGKDCSLTFVLDSRGAVTRVSAPKNVTFTVETPTEAIVLPDGQTDDLILEPGEKEWNVPAFLPFFMGLEEQGGWTLSCIPYLGRSDIRISADLKKWEFRPEPLEEYTFVIQSCKDVWTKVGEKLNTQDRKPIAWKPPFPAKYSAAFPMSGDLFPVGEPKYQVWGLMEERPDNQRTIHYSNRIYAINKKARTGWSSGIYGTAPYPAFLSLEGQADLICPRIARFKQCQFDPARPVYIYTYYNGSHPKRPDTPLNFLPEYSRPVMFSRPSGSIGIGPATCDKTREIEKIYQHDEARAKREVIMDGLARMQMFVESIRNRIGRFREWAKEMKAKCLAAAEKDSAAADDLKKFAAYFDCMEKVYQLEQARMATPEKVWELGQELLKNLDNKEMDDEALEKHCMEYGRAVRTIGGAQDNCVAECHYVTRMLRLEALAAYMRSGNQTAKEFYRKLYLSTTDLLQNSFNHEGK